MVRTLPEDSFPERMISWDMVKTVRTCGMPEREEEVRDHSAIHNFLPWGFRAARREGRVLGEAK
jgi:hypothetical protein